MLKNWNEITEGVDLNQKPKYNNKVINDVKKPTNNLYDIFTGITDLLNNKDTNENMLIKLNKLIELEKINIPNFDNKIMKDKYISAYKFCNNSIDCKDYYEHKKCNYDHFPHHKFYKSMLLLKNDLINNDDSKKHIYLKTLWYGISNMYKEMQLIEKYNIEL